MSEALNSVGKIWLEEDGSHLLASFDPPIEDPSAFRTRLYTEDLIVTDKEGRLLQAIFPRDTFIQGRDGGKSDFRSLMRQQGRLVDYELASKQVQNVRNSEVPSAVKNAVSETLHDMVQKQAA